MTIRQVRERVRRASATELARLQNEIALAEELEEPTRRACLLVIREELELRQHEGLNRTIERALTRPDEDLVKLAGFALGLYLGMKLG